SGETIASFGGIKVGNAEQSLAFSSGGAWLASSRPGGVTIWDTHTWQILRQLSGGQKAVAFSPDDRVLAAADAGGVSLWDTSRWERRGLQTRAASSAYAHIALATDGRHLVVGSKN